MADPKGQVKAGGDSPGDFLKELTGKPVVVKLNSGVDYRGPLIRSMHIVSKQKESTL